MIPLNNAKYEDREAVKALGGMWSKPLSKWYVPKGKDPMAFLAYMDDATKDIVQSVSSYYQAQMSAMAKENRGLNARMSSLEKKTEDLSAEVRAFRTLSGPPLEEGHGERTIKNAGQMSFEQRSFYERPKSFIAIDYPALGLPRDFVVIDTETTGLGNDDEVVELSVLDSNANELYHSFFKPEKPVHPQAAKKTGIQNRFLKDCPTFTEEWPKIVAAIDSRPIAGHNILFDKRLIQQTLEKQTGMNCGEYCDRIFTDCIDSWRLAGDMHITKGSKSLETLCAAIGVEQSPNHRSSHDCLGVLYVLQHFERTLEERRATRRTPDVCDGFGDGSEVLKEIL